jgi:hypothetical protein
MGFWDDYKEPASGNYISAAEKQALAEGGIPFEVTGVDYEETGGIQGAPRFVLYVNLPDPATGDDEVRLMTFAAGSGAESRDRMLHAMIGYFEGAEAAPFQAKVEKVGRAWFIRKA